MSEPITLLSGVRRLTAPNAGPMTFEGTNSYLVGTRTVAIIDPGPDDPDHRARLLAAIGSGVVSHILVTHGHIDHSAGAAALSEVLGVPVSAFGPATAGRSNAMQDLAQRQQIAGGEGLDLDFSPEVALPDGAVIETDEWRIEALHTPGHLSSHMSFALPDLGAILTGDTVMGWSTTLISPPDGSVSAFLASLDRLAARPEQLYLPGHGPEVANGPALAAKQRAHRMEREAQVIEALRHAPDTPDGLTARIYKGVPTHLHPAAARNVLAHLIDLGEQGRLKLPDGPLSDAVYSLNETLE